MRHKLTPAFVLRAPPPPPPPTGDRIVYWDESLPCFGLVVTKSDHKSWIVQYRANGISRRITFKHVSRGGLSLDEARKEARKVIGAVTRGGDPLMERRRATNDTFRAIADEFLERVGSRQRSQDKQQKTLERLVHPTLGNRQVKDIRRSDIVRLLDRIADESGPRMADTTLAHIRRILNWHASRADDYRSPIVRGMARTKPKERERARILSDDELRAVWRPQKRSQARLGDWCSSCC